jgi:hypothetical protein
MLEQGRHGDARPLLREALAATSAVGDGVEAAWILHVMAVEAAQEGRPIRAARLEGSAAAIDHELGSQLEPADASFVERNLAAARSQTDDGAFESALREGAVFSLAEAVEYALGSSTD